MKSRMFLVGGLVAALLGCSDSNASDKGSGGSLARGGSGGDEVSGGKGGSVSATGGTQSPPGGAPTGGSAGSGGKAADPSVLTEQPAIIDELKLDASHVYWLEGHNRILSMPLAGGTPSVVYASTTPGKYEALHIALDADKLYFTDQGVRDPVKPRGLFSIPLDGSAERTQLLTTASIDNLAIAGGYVYFTANDSIARISTSGGAATALVRNINTDTPVVVHDGYVYFWYAPDAAVVQNVYRVSIDTDKGPLVPDAGGAGGAGGDGGAGGTGGNAGTAAAIEAEQLSNTTRYSELILSPQVDEGHVYWSIYDELYRYPIAGGEQEKFGMLSKDSITLLLVDHGDIYWGGGSLRQFVVGGDSHTNVVTGAQGINAVAVNDSHVFVADGKLLRRVSRP